MITLDDVDIFELIADAEARIGAMHYGDSYALYELIYDVANRIAPLGCFYVCLYSPGSEEIHFAYNRDGDYLEEPCTLPLGDGPTSWVIRNHRPFILNETNAAVQRRGIAFGDTTRRSESAIHLPMRTIGAGGKRHVIGVLSAQSYEPHSFGPSAIALLQTLADRAATILHQDSEHEECRRRIAAAEIEVDSLHRQMAQLSEQYLDLITEVSHQALALQSITPADHPALRSAEMALYRTCHRIATEVIEAPICFRMIHDEPTAPAKSASPPTLTEREYEIAALLATGRSNGAIAKALFVSVNTVKFHCANIYLKLNVRNRVQAVQAAAELLAGRGTMNEER